jgi:L-asparagine transporter-like permease
MIYSILGQIKVEVAPHIQLPVSLLASDNKIKTDLPSSSRMPTTNQTKKTPKKAAKANKEKVRERGWKSRTSCL